MELKLIVMITTLVLPNGDASVNVKPFATAEVCKEQADIEASDPFVKEVECAELADGVLMLQFKQDQLTQKTDPESPDEDDQKVAAKTD